MSKFKMFGLLLLAGVSVARAEAFVVADAGADVVTAIEGVCTVQGLIYGAGILFVLAILGYKLLKRGVAAA